MDTDMAGKPAGYEKKLRVGIMIKDTDRLRSYERRIVRSISCNPELDLVLLIKDGRDACGITKHPESVSAIYPDIAAGGSAASILFSLQTKIENFMLKRKGKAKDIISVSEDTCNTEGAVSIYLSPECSAGIDIFSDDDCAAVKNYNLDLIVKLEFGPMQGAIANAAHYGLWSIFYGDISADRIGPPGFGEIAAAMPCCEVSVLRLLQEPGSVQIIDKAWFNWHESYLKTYRSLHEKSVVLLLKNISRLARQSGSGTENPQLPVYHIKPQRNPELRELIPYMTRLYMRAFSQKIDEIFNRRSYAWSLFFGRGDFCRAKLSSINPIALPEAKEYWSDPFLFEHDNELYVFFEIYPYKSKKGKLSCGRLTEPEKGKYAVADITDVLNLDYHLSYPHIFREDGDIFMIPETNNNRRLEIYRCTRFPDSWELYSTAFEGENVKDTTYFRDDNGDRWLFTNKGWGSEAELYIYKIDSLKLKKISHHTGNPVIIDCRRGRNGGAVFKHKGDYYRPAQINTYGIYGRGLQINKIKKLTLDIYEDEPFMTIEPDFKKGLIGVHHLHQSDGNFVFDACYKRYKQRKLS